MKYVVDIAIIPPKEIYDLCIEVNSKDPIQKFGEFNLPHISLGMGIVDDIPETLLILKNIFEKYAGLNLKIIGHNFKPMRDLGNHYSFTIEITEELRELQKEILENIPFLNEKPKIEMYSEKFEPMLEDDEYFNYVKNFKEVAAGENFWPHISLRCRDPGNVNYPIEFKAEKIAICLMGNRCTCAEILGEVNLK